MGLKRQTKIWLAVIIFLVLNNSPVIYGQQTATDVKPLDVILLIDSSPSMARSDSDGLRINAAHYLIDYLEATSQVLGVNFRAGVANFGGKVGETMPLRLVQGGAVHSALKVEQISFTDFRPPLDFALRELRPRSFGTDNQMLVIIFTDGNPELSKGTLSPDDKSRYFSGKSIAGDSSSFKMNLLVRELQGAGVALFVVAVGDASNDAQYWRQLIPFSHYRSIKTTTNLADVYHQFLVELVGFAGGKEVKLTAAHEHKEILQPYLDQVIFSFIKDKTDSRITVIDPAGNIISPTMGGKPNELHEIYSIPVPRWDHPWQIRVAGSNALMWVDQRMPVLAHRLPGQSIVAGRPVLLRAQILRQKMPVIDSTLEIKATLTTPTGKKGASLFLERNSNGEYHKVISDLHEYGTYSISFTASLNDKPLEMRSQAASVHVYPVPFIDYLIATKDSTDKKLITLMAHIQHTDRLQTDSTVITRVLETSGAEAAKIELRDDGKFPDKAANDEFYTALARLPEKEEDYFFQGILTGQSKDGLPYDSRYALPTGLIGKTPIISKKAKAESSFKFNPLLFFLIIIVLATGFLLFKNHVGNLAGKIGDFAAAVDTHSGQEDVIRQLERILSVGSLKRHGMLRIFLNKDAEEKVWENVRQYIKQIYKKPELLKFIDADHPEVPRMFKKLFEILNGLKAQDELWFDLLNCLMNQQGFRLKVIGTEAFLNHLDTGGKNSEIGESFAEASYRGTESKLF